MKTSTASSLWIVFVIAVVCCAQILMAAPKASFQLDMRAKRKLVEKALILKRGDSYESVTNSLGSPTYDQILAKKENNRTIGRVLKYYVVTREKGLVSESDELVEIFLDERNSVRTVSIRVSIE